MNIFSDLTTTSTGLEIHINADGDATGPGTLSVSASRTGVLTLLYVCPHSPHANICVSGLLFVCRMWTRRGLCDAERQCVAHSSSPTTAYVSIRQHTSEHVSIRECAQCCTDAQCVAHSSSTTISTTISITHAQRRAHSQCTALLLLLYQYMRAHTTICVSGLLYLCRMVTLRGLGTSRA